MAEHILAGQDIRGLFLIIGKFIIPGNCIFAKSVFINSGSRMFSAIV